MSLRRNRADQRSSPQGTQADREHLRPLDPIDRSNGACRMRRLPRTACGLRIGPAHRCRRLHGVWLSIRIARSAASLSVVGVDWRRVESCVVPPPPECSSVSERGGSIGSVPVTHRAPIREPSIACHPPRHSRSVPQLHPTVSIVGLATAPYAGHIGPRRGNVSHEENTMTNWAGCVPGSNHPAGSDFAYSAGGMRGG